MSNVPAWKRALLEKKKQQEQQEELKKQQEQEAYIKSLPPWKRAIVMRDLEKKKSASASPATSAGKATGNAPTNLAGQDKWKAALSQANKLSESPARNRVTWGSAQAKEVSSSESTPIIKSSTPTNKPSWARTSSPSTLTPSQVANSRESTPSSKPSWIRTPSPKLPTTPSLSTSDSLSPETVREERRGSVQSIADQFHKASSTSSPPQSPLGNTQQLAKKEAAQAQPTKKETPQQAKQKVTTLQQVPPTPATTVQIDDSDLEGLPPWKKALIIKKRLKQAGLSEVPVQKNEEANKVATSCGQNDAQTHSSKANTTPPARSRGKSRPDVVNRSDGDNSGPNKLLQKEGVTLRPPIFSEVDQWANVSTDDPKFTQLPPWKQAMILRRRKDIAKRSGQETSPPESPTVQSVSEKTKRSTSSSSQLENEKKTSKKSPTKSSGKIEGKKTTNKAKTKAEEKKANTKSSNKSKTKEKQNTKTVESSSSSSQTKSSLAGRQGTSGSGSGLKPVRPAPTKPQSKETSVNEDKKEEKNDEDEEEPMFTWNFSKHSVETGDAMSNSSDSELEDVQITSIDDELSDEDDSGIGVSGGTILMSYKPLTETEDEKKPKECPPSNNTTDLEIQIMMETSESKSILVDPSKKSYKVSKVSELSNTSFLAVMLGCIR